MRKHPVTRILAAVALSVLIYGLATSQTACSGGNDTSTGLTNTSTFTDTSTLTSTSTGSGTLTGTGTGSATSTGTATSTNTGTVTGTNTNTSTNTGTSTSTSTNTNTSTATSTGTVSPLTISPNTTSVSPGQTIIFTISGGTPPYNVDFESSEDVTSYSSEAEAESNLGYGSSYGWYIAGTNSPAQDFVHGYDSGGQDVYMEVLVGTTATGTSTSTSTATNTDTGTYYTCNLYSSTRPTGKVTSAEITGGKIQLTYGVGTITYGFAKFSTSNVPGYANIDKVVLCYYIESVRDEFEYSYRIERYLVDPDTASVTQLFSSADTYSQHLSTFVPHTTVGWHEVQLNNYYLSDLVDDIKNKGYLALKWYAC